MAGVVQAAYDPVTATGAWRPRLAGALRYYATRPGADKEREEREAGERGHPGVRGRWFTTSDGDRLPLKEAEARFAAAVEARRRAALERQAARARELSERYGRPVRLPDPVQRVYRVVVSTRWAALPDRDVAEILGRAFGGRTGAAAGVAGCEGGEWMYVRHGNTEHPHIHAVAVTDGRGLDVRELERFREHVTEKEALREREQRRGRTPWDREHDPDDRDRGRGLEW